MTEPGDERGRVLSTLGLLLCPGLGPVRVGRLLRRFGTPDAVLAASPAALAEVHGVGEATARRAAAGFNNARAKAQDELRNLEDHGGHALRLGGLGYPAALADIEDPPPVLFVRGALDGEGADAVALGVVGSRRCTTYGTEQATRFAEHLAAAGLSIVSGGARGIDAAAHRGALRGLGRTIVVLGCGHGHTYPPEHAGLFQDILESGRGALITELPWTTEPRKEHFPTRNRIISGMSLGVLVIEAARPSGALITARLAAEEHHREVMALPGRVDSASSEGSLELLKSGGAHLVTQPADVLGLLEGPARLAFAHRPAPPEPAGTNGALFAEPPAQQSPAAHADADPVLSALQTGPCTADELSSRTGLAAGDLRGRLTMLEIEGRVRKVGPRYERVARGPS